MATEIGPDIVEDGLIYLIDSNSTRSYPGSGTTVYPMVAANNNNATLNGSITYTSGANGGFNFNGPTTFDNISVTETVTHKTGQSFSYDVWVYFDALSGYDKTIVGKVGCNIGLIQAGSSMRMQVFGPNGACASGNTNYTATSSITTGQWMYAAGTYEVGVGVKLYMNGVLASTVAYTGNIGNYPDVLFFGGSINANYAMDGRIGGAKVYNKTLTQAEVTQNFNAARKRFGI
jgi:hypothetical protein